MSFNAIQEFSAVTLVKLPLYFLYAHFYRSGGQPIGSANPLEMDLMKTLTTRTQEEIMTEINALQELQAIVPQFMRFEDGELSEHDNHEAIAAQIKTLEKNLTFELITEEDWSEYAEEHALEARDWMRCELSDPPSADWLSLVEV
jgi:hypothetical protein